MINIGLARAFNCGLTVVFERIVTLEQGRRGQVLVRIETKRHRPVQRCPVPGRYQAAISSTERRVDQVLRIDLLNLRVHVHVLVHAPTET